MVYCQFDGYLEGVGKKLIEKYNNRESALKIVSYGSIDALGKEDKRNVPTLYCTDKEYNINNQSIDGEYLYLFKNGYWYYQTIGMERWLKIILDKNIL